MRVMRDVPKIGTSFLKNFEDFESLKKDSVPSKRAGNVMKQHDDRFQE